MSALCCCSILCCWGWDALPTVKFATAKWLYLTGFTLTSVATWVLRDYASQGFADTVGQVAKFCGDANAENQAACGAGQIAMRISLANVCFFGLHALLTFHMTKESDPRVNIHSTFWLLKILIWIGALIGFFYIPSSSIYHYAQVARIGSGFFLVLQLLLLINLVYEVNEWLTEKDNKPAWVVLVLGSAVCFVLGLVLIGFSYHLYTASPSCHLNIFFCTWSLIMLFALVGVLFVPGRAPTAGLLTSGALFLYASYLLISALSSQRAEDYVGCHRNGGANPRWIQIVGFFIALAAVIYSTFTAGVASKDVFGNKTAGEGLDEPLPYRADFFHLVFALASMYIAMLFSNWEVSPNTHEFELDVGTISMWVKIVSKWVCELLYCWSVVAPALFPHRDFGP